jgi:hypothetical protein
MFSYQQSLDVSKNFVHSVKLEPCTINHWSSIPSFQKIYNKTLAKNWLCIPINTELPLMGNRNSPSQALTLTYLSQCANGTMANPCAPQS